MKTTVSLISFPLLVMILLLSTIFSSGIGTANAQEHSVIGTIPVGPRSDGVAVNPTNGLVYVTHPMGSKPFFGTIIPGRLSVINGTTNTVVATIPVDRQDAVAVNPTNGLVYVTSSFPSNTVSVINGTTNTVVATIPVGQGPGDVAVNPTNGLVYVTNFHSNVVSVISTVS